MVGLWRPIAAGPSRVEKACGVGGFLSGHGKKGREYRVIHSKGTGADSGQYVAAKHRGEVGPWSLGKLEEGS